MLGMWEQHNLLSGLEGMTMRLFQQALGWTEAEVQVFLVGLRKDLMNTKYHTYYP